MDTVPPSLWSGRAAWAPARGWGGVLEGLEGGGGGRSSG